MTLFTRKNPRDRRAGYTLRERYDRWRVRRRFDIAAVLNRFRRWCWCDLVDWALAADSDRRPDPGEKHSLLVPRENFPRPILFQAVATGPCVEDAGKVGTCYCAKFRTAECQASGNFGGGGFLVPESDEVTR